MRKVTNKSPNKLTIKKGDALTIQKLTRYTLSLQQGKSFSEYPMPQENMAIGILLHRNPNETQSEMFTKRHMARVILQHSMAKTPSPNPILAGHACVAQPIFAGYDPQKKSFMTVLKFDASSRGFPLRSPRLVDVLALERSVCNIWSRGYRFNAFTNNILRSIRITPAFDVIFIDCSQLIHDTLLTQKFTTLTPGSIRNYSFTTYYVPQKEQELLIPLFEKVKAKKLDDAFVQEERLKFWGVSKNNLARQ